MKLGKSLDTTATIALADHESALQSLKGEHTDAIAALQAQLTQATAEATSLKEQLQIKASDNQELEGVLTDLKAEVSSFKASLDEAVKNQVTDILASTGNEPLPLDDAKPAIVKKTQAEVNAMSAKDRYDFIQAVDSGTAQFI